jgi:hypothetical protein
MVFGEVRGLFKGSGFPEVNRFCDGRRPSGRSSCRTATKPFHLAFLMTYVASGAAMMQNTVMRNCQPEFLEVAMQVMEMLTRYILPDQFVTNPGKSGM